MAEKKEQEGKELTWKTKEGKVIPIAEMDNRHLLNTVLLLERNQVHKLATFYKAKIEKILEETREYLRNDNSYLDNYLPIYSLQTSITRLTARYCTNTNMEWKGRLSPEYYLMTKELISRGIDTSKMRHRIPYTRITKMRVYDIVSMCNIKWIQDMFAVRPYDWIVTKSDLSSKGLNITWMDIHLMSALPKEYEKISLESARSDLIWVPVGFDPIMMDFQIDVLIKKAVEGKNQERMEQIVKSFGKELKDHVLVGAEDDTDSAMSGILAESMTHSSHVALKVVWLSHLLREFGLISTKRR